MEYLNLSSKVAIDVKGILNVGVAAQAVALAGHNLKLVTKKKKTTKDFLKVGITNIVGVPLLQTQSQLIGKL